MLQETLQKILLPSFVRPTYVNALMDHIHADSLNITFYLHELLPLEVTSLADPLMKIIHVNSIGIRRTLVDTSSALNVCGLDLFPKIKVDPNSLATFSLFNWGFDKSGKTIVGNFILSLKVKPVTIMTLVHVMPSPSSYNLLLGRPWLHSLGVVSYTLYGFVNFVANNQVVIVKDDPDAMQLCQIAVASQTSIAPSFQYYVPTLSSSMATFVSLSSSKKE